MKQAITTKFKNIIPFRPWWPLLAGVATGIVVRLIFSGKAGDPYGAMMGSFIYLSPMLVGVVTVYVAERIKRRSWGYYFLAPFVANCLFVIGTLAILIEGLICAVVIIPLFALLGGLGGLVMGAICRLTNWPGKAVYSFMVLPLVLGGLETNLPLPEEISTVERSVLINATPDAVWREINAVRNIKPEEVNNAWAYRIGVPLPVSGVTEQTPDGPVRRIKMGKGIYFDQVFVDWRENRYVRWHYRFYEDSFPPKALDDHVMIGGHYFDIEETSYMLEPKGSGTELTINMRYRVSTQFNWYADPIARLLFGNFEEVILDFYRRRSEA